MKAIALGIVGGLILGVSAPQLYDGVEVGMLSCADHHQSAACEANYLRTAVAEGGTLVGLLSSIAALWLGRRRRR